LVSHSAGGTGSAIQIKLQVRQKGKSLSALMTFHNPMLTANQLLKCHPKTWPLNALGLDLARRQSEQMLYINAQRSASWGILARSTGMPIC
jgi:hypothetical protein